MIGYHKTRQNWVISRRERSNCCFNSLLGGSRQGATRLFQEVQQEAMDRRQWTGIATRKISDSTKMFISRGRQKTHAVQRGCGISILSDIQALVAWPWGTWSDPEFTLSGGFGPKFSMSVKEKKGKEKENGKGLSFLKNTHLMHTLFENSATGVQQKLLKKGG